MSPTVPIAVRNVTSGIADLHDAVKRVTEIEDANELYEALRECEKRVLAATTLAGQKVNALTDVRRI